MIDYKNYGLDDKRGNIFVRGFEWIKSVRSTAWILICDNKIEIVAGGIVFVMFIVGLLLWIEQLPDPVGLK